MSTPKAISIHIGLNHIDPGHYGDDGALSGCHNDAKDMYQLAQKAGFKASKPLLDKQAKAAVVTAKILAAAKSLGDGDSFLLTYSGHGSQVEDINEGEEIDGLDETWCLYDRMLLDDELALMWSKFKPGVRITVISDSCHSGTVTRAVFSPPGAADRGGPRKFRLLPEKLRKKAVKDWAGIYRAIQLKTPKETDLRIKATILLISGCQDHQLSQDGTRNGLFTSKLLRVWDGGKFTGSCKLLRAKVIRLMPSDQQPNYYRVGAKNGDFESAPALRPAPASAAEPTSAPRTRTRSAARSVETPIQFVLRELEASGLRKPKADTNITKFFAEMEKIDQQLGSPSRTALFRELFNNRFGTRLGFADLIKGRYRTPQAIANIAG